MAGLTVTIRVLIVLALIGSPLPVRAQDVDQRLKALEDEVAALKRAQADRGGDRFTGLTVTGGDVSLALSGYLQLDARTTFHERPGADEFYVRRARLVLDGKVGDLAWFTVSPDFSNNALYDAYIDLRPGGAATLRLGKFKVPFGLEMLQSAAYLLFAERGLTFDLVPDRDIGLDVHGDAGAVHYALGLFDGVQDGGRLDGDDNDSKSVAARVFAAPFAGTGALSGIGLGVAGTWSSQGEGTLPSYKTSIGQTSFFTYRSGVTAAGRHVRVAPQLSYYHGPFGGFAEYVRSSQVLAGAAGSSRVADSAWQAVASWVLTGENASYHGVTPRRPVTRDDWAAGAVQLAFRYADFRVDGSAFTGGAASLADPIANAHRVREATIGANWYLDARLRMLLDAAHTRFSGGARGADWSAVARLQATF